MIEFQRVSKTYPGGFEAVREFSLVIPDRSIFVLVGSSGSGKTTLLRMVNRMIEPTSGRVLIDDEDVRDQDPVQLRRSIGYVLQDGGLMPHRNVLDNVVAVPILNGVSRLVAHGSAKKLLEQVGLTPDLGHRYPAQLSGGQRQRVGVARALAANPTILLMDEPFGAVDPIVRRELQDELKALQAELGKTIVFVTHDVDEAVRLADYMAVLAEHAIIAQVGSPQSILAQPADDFVRDFVGTDSQRVLTVRQVGGRDLAIDATGRPVGVLS
ncbi:MAG: ATP-binding cassette domain-containing protein [Propionibacteriaceae bacterium]|nr:ATP-binding cassette domain-containing protein [Propionibacteriaceae bacterium]